VDIRNGAEQSRHEEPLRTRNPFERAHALPKLGVDLLVCGMISRKQQAALGQAGVRIVPHICGPIDEVIAACVADRLGDGDLLMPGCGRRRETPDRE